MKFSRPCLVALFLLVLANSANGQTVGNGTIIPLSAGERESYGVNSVQPNPSADAVGGFATRHYKRGGASGIGGSFIGTTSPTSESSPAAVRPIAAPTTRQEFRLPRLQSSFSLGQTNPALKTVSPALPGLPGSSALTSPFSTFAGQTSTIGVEELPSFSRRESPISKMQFNRFGIGDSTK